MNNKKLYLYYYNSNGNRVPIKYFSDFSVMRAWCNLYCINENGHYYYKGNLVLCGYYLGM